METKQQRAAFLAAAKKVESEADSAPTRQSEGFLQFMNRFLDLETFGQGFAISNRTKLDLLIEDALRAHFRRLMPGVMKTIVPKLAEDPRLEAFRQFAIGKTERAETLIRGILSAYSESLKPDVRPTIQDQLKQYFGNLRASARQLNFSFKMRIMEDPDPVGPLMNPDDRSMFLIHLGQALATIDFLEAAFDEHFKMVPSTRKKGGKAGSKVMFALLIGNFFKNEFGSTKDEFAAALTEALFSDGKDRLNAVRKAREGWENERRPDRDDDRPHKAARDVILNDNDD